MNGVLLVVWLCSLTHTRTHTHVHTHAHTHKHTHVTNTHNAQLKKKFYFSMKHSPLLLTFPLPWDHLYFYFFSTLSCNQEPSNFSHGKYSTSTQFSWHSFLSRCFKRRRCCHECHVHVEIFAKTQISTFWSFLRIVPRIQCYTLKERKTGTNKAHISLYEPCVSLNVLVGHLLAVLSV